MERDQIQCPTIFFPDLWWSKTDLAACVSEAVTEKILGPAPWKALGNVGKMNSKKPEVGISKGWESLIVALNFKGNIEYGYPQLLISPF